MCDIGRVQAEVEFLPLVLDEQPVPATGPIEEPVAVEQSVAAPTPVR